MATESLAGSEPVANGTKEANATNGVNGKAKAEETNGTTTPASEATESSKTEDTENTDTEAEEDEKPKEPKVPFGSISTMKNIYKSPKDADGNWTWVDKYPEDAEEAAENEETERYAVVVRNIKSQDSRKKLEADSIVVQSPWLRTALGEILEDYPGVACELQRLEFDAPFAPFVHRWKELVKYRERKDLDEKAREHLTLLHDILQYEIGNDIKAFEDYMLNGVIKFDHLWMIFQPGSLVLAAHKGPLSAFELDETEYMATQCGKFLEIRADCIDHSGSSFGRYQETLKIPEFIGTKKITSLNVYPWLFHENKEAVRRSLTKRGEIFESLAGHHYKAYEGTAITWDRDYNERPIQVTGRIVVDIGSFNRYSPYPERYLSELNAKDIEMLSDHRRLHGTNEDGGVKLTPYHQMLARSRTRGYSLKLKQWLDFYVEQVIDITWNTSAFEKLVLPDDQKELILAFSESQLEGSSFDDVISGKGKGIICLLSGPPGVGKTLTSEAVAENLRVPLHTLSSGDLGSSPWEVENSLTRILDLVARWNAILLLDECDVFLEARSTHDLERNKIVSIFLRTLEYYEGILFMTTNRVDNIDPAFQSRIHVSLEYPDLTTESRRVIWQNFLNSPSLKCEFSEKDLDELAELKLNGRQIKNVLKTSQLLAARRKSVLKRQFVDTVLSIERRRPGPSQ